MKLRTGPNHALDRTAGKALVSGGHGRLFPTGRVGLHHQAFGHRERSMTTHLRIQANSEPRFIMSAHSRVKRSPRGCGLRPRGPFQKGLLSFVFIVALSNREAHPQEAIDVMGYVHPPHILISNSAPSVAWYTLKAPPREEYSGALDDVLKGLETYYNSHFGRTKPRCVDLHWHDGVSEYDLFQLFKRLTEMHVQYVHMFNLQLEIVPRAKVYQNVRQE